MGQYSSAQSPNVSDSSRSNVAGLTGWKAVAALAPRARVRVAAVDEATGLPLNEYKHTVSVRGAEPSLPYAMHLASAGKYRLLAFDLDATNTSPTVVLEDLAQLRGWLEAAGIPCLVAASGPGGGRHVWVAIDGDGVESGRVAVLARALAARLPTLDIAPLTNPHTGCVRPPGAPHRSPGWTSSLVDGGWDVLLEPVATAASVEALLDLVGPAPTPVARRSASVSIATDAEGHPYVPGSVRALPATSRRALESPVANDGTASAQAFSVLLGAVRAHWRVTQVAELVATAPGLEHFRSARPASGRGPRPERAQHQRLPLLYRQWERAVLTVANSPVGGGDGADERFEGRLRAVLEVVTRLQARADGCPRRWSRPGGPADRRALDYACLLALAGVSAEVDLDIRSVALGTGLGRETARTALSRLALEAWISLNTPSSGPLAASWVLGGVIEQEKPEEAGHRPVPAEEKPMIKNSEPGFYTGVEYQTRSHVVPPPAAGVPPALHSAQLLSLRAAWSARLQYRLSAQTHDCFIGTGHGLGHHAAAVFAALEIAGDAAGGWASLENLVEQTGRTAVELGRRLSVLAAHRLARSKAPRAAAIGARWRAGSRRHRIGAARTLGIEGTLAVRTRVVTEDREVWAWWLAELDWMHTPARARPEWKRRRVGGMRTRQAGPGQQVLPLPGAITARHRYGAYPRHPGRGGASGRADHATARANLRARRVAA